jgi:hypothetical protein
MMSVQTFRNKRSGFNSDNIDPKKLKYVRFHESTNISKQALKIEKKLLTELNNIMRFFKENYMSKGIDPINYINTYQEFRMDMEIQVLNIIKSYVTKTYSLATEYVADALSVSGFLTKSDIDTIEELSQNFNERFFGRIRNVLERGVTKFYKSLTDVFIPAYFNTNNDSIDNNEAALNVLATNIERSQSFIFSSLAILIITTTINKATIIKTRKIILDMATLPNQQVSMFQGAIDENEDVDDILRDLPVNDLKDVKQGNIFYIWKTAEDDRVCLNYCLPLEDHVYSILDPFVPEPEQDTHYNCRCRLMLVRNDRTLQEI